MSRRAKKLPLAEAFAKAFAPRPEDDDPPPKLDWGKPSLAVIACRGGAGVVLYSAGPHVESMIDGGGSRLLDDLGLDDAPDGISVWEGGIKSVHINTPDAYEYDAWLEGTFREPTGEEWQAICRGECPWPDENWWMA
jgi:hypothetical protein